MKKIAIVGSTGSGKSCFAARLGKHLGYPVIDLDDLYWQPGWVPQPPDVFQQKIEDIAAGSSWIMTGNYSRVHWPYADTIIWLDYPFWLVLGRLLRRSARRIWMQEKICNGNVETVRRLLSRNSLVVWFFQSFWRRRREYSVIFSEPLDWPDKKLIWVKSSAEAERILQSHSAYTTAVWA